MIVYRLGQTYTQVLNRAVTLLMLPPWTFCKKAHLKNRTEPAFQGHV